jgi:hypothetical protein
MLLNLFESRERAHKDKIELQNLHSEFGDELRVILQKRANDSDLGVRHRKHWQRLSRKAKRLSF